MELGNIPAKVTEVVKYAADSTKGEVVKLPPSQDTLDLSTAAKKLPEQKTGFLEKVQEQAQGAISQLSEVGKNLGVLPKDHQRKLAAGAEAAQDAGTSLEAGEIKAGFCQVGPRRGVSIEQWVQNTMKPENRLGNGKDAVAYVNPGSNSVLRVSEQQANAIEKGEIPDFSNYVEILVQYKNPELADNPRLGLPQSIFVPETHSLAQKDRITASEAFPVASDDKSLLAEEDKVHFQVLNEVKGKHPTHGYQEAYAKLRGAYDVNPRDPHNEKEAMAKLKELLKPDPERENAALKSLKKRDPNYPNEELGKLYCMRPLKGISREERGEIQELKAYLHIDGTQFLRAMEKGEKYIPVWKDGSTGRTFSSYAVKDFYKNYLAFEKAYPQQIKEISEMPQEKAYNQRLRDKELLGQEGIGEDAQHPFNTKIGPDFGVFDLQFGPHSEHYPVRKGPIEDFKEVLLGYSQGIGLPHRYIVRPEAKAELEPHLRRIDQKFEQAKKETGLFQ
jgi:hypothetical protein